MVPLMSSIIVDLILEHGLELVMMRVLLLIYPCCLIRDSGGYIPGASLYRPNERLRRVVMRLSFVDTSVQLKQLSYVLMVFRKLYFWDFKGLRSSWTYCTEGGRIIQLLFLCDDASIQFK